MSTDQADVFEPQQEDQTQETQQQPSQQEPTQEQQSPLGDLVGEGKKYKTVEDLVAGFYHAQNHIATIEQENEEFRNKMEQQESEYRGSQAVLDALEQRNTPSQKEPTSSNSSDEEAVRNLVEQVVEQKSTEQKKADNIKKANQRATEMYGDKAKSKVEEAAASLNVSVDFLRQTASTSPAAFEKLVAENTQQGQNTMTGASPQPSNVNTQAMPKHDGEKNFAYYNKLRKENPSAFKSVAVQKEMMQQRSRLGKDFFN